VSVSVSVSVCLCACVYSSAEREGSVQVGDTLLAIGDRVLEGMTTDSLVKLLVGPQVWQ